MSEAAFIEILKIINEPGTTWKTKRTLLRDRFEINDEMIEALVPRPDGEDL